MTRATFTGHAPERDDGLRQIDYPALTAEQRAVVDRFQRDAIKHRDDLNRKALERQAQAALYGAGA